MEPLRLLQRPIYGGVFGEGRYALATTPCISHGLYAIRYMVVESVAGLVLSISDSKVSALADARRLLAAANDLHGPKPETLCEQLLLWDSDASTNAPSRRRPVSRRRREIFDKCEGRCHYCATPLQLEAAWHVEHMQPRALGGSDAPLNLVASCTSCNLRKADRTALEYMAAAV